MNKGTAARLGSLLLVVGLVASACASPSSPDFPPDAIRVVGTVRYSTIEGGFWAVQGDDGVTYDPMNGVPPAFQTEGLRVVLIAIVRTDVASVHMVGPIVEILHIQRL